MKIGKKASITKKITQEDIINYSKISLDDNPLHLNEEYAKNSIFKKRIAHGMIAAGLISAVLGTKLPGKGSIYLEQNLKFLKPVYINDDITATVEIKKIENKIVTLETFCINQEGKIILKGEAKILKENIWLNFWMYYQAH